MMKRFLMATTALIAAAGTSYGEPQRTMVTVENKFPALHKVEAGLIGQESDMDTREMTSLAPYIRYGLVPNLTVYGAVPLVDASSDFGGDGTGLGDVRAGLQLLAYEDVFRYPWVVPHVDVQFATGDEDDGTGHGENIYMFGISVGSTMYDRFHFVADVSYGLNGRNIEEDENDQIVISGSLVWDLSEKFAVIGEARFTDENSGNDKPKFGQFGMHYEFTDSFALGAYVGGWTDTAQDQTDVTIKGSYMF